jgi:hypothetical protein
MDDIPKIATIVTTVSISWNSQPHSANKSTASSTRSAKPTKRTLPHALFLSLCDRRIMKLLRDDYVLLARPHGLSLAAFTMSRPSCLASSRARLSSKTGNCPCTPLKGHFFAVTGVICSHKRNFSRCSCKGMAL